MHRKQIDRAQQMATGDHYGLDYVEVLGARTHNLKNINVTFPRNKLVVITGVSGSGKSSLAFDTINAEGQRRYRESFSAYARSFLGNLTKPEVDKINGLSPVIAIKQKTTSYNGRSTVGTITEIYDFMRLLFARIAYSTADTGDNSVKKSEEDILSHLLQQFLGKTITFMAPLVKGKKGHHQALIQKFINLGFHKIRLNGVITPLDASLKPARHKKHDIYLIIDHIPIALADQDRVEQAIQLAMKYGQGTLVVMDEQQKTYAFSKVFVDGKKRFAYDEPEPRLFSFNTPYGACPTCRGIGEITQVDVEAMVPDRTISIKKGAIFPLGSYKKTLLFTKIEALLTCCGYAITDPIGELPLPILNLLLFGNIVAHPVDILPNFPEPFEGIIQALIKQQERKKGEQEDFQYTAICSDCSGTRLNKVARSFKIHNKSIADLSHMNLLAMQQWLIELPPFLTKKQQAIAHDLLKEIHKRLNFLIEVGLHYLSLDRGVHTLSGGEAQRIRLATQIGNQLLGVLYILDEPSIGLHQRDNARLIAALQSLRDIGNTVLVVEHDKEIMLNADYLIEIGPGAGLYGGEVVAAGNLIEFLQQSSVTADFLTYKREFLTSNLPIKDSYNYLTLTGCRGHNLKNITLTIPLGLMVCITGVSGSGKSSLIHKTLLPILKKQLYRSAAVPLAYDQVSGLNHIHKVVEVNQAPIGTTPRSNPSTYTGMFTDIRNFFALLPEAKIRGYKPARFSFNLKGGRCNPCEGVGVQRIEMGFLPDVYVTCDSCKGKRYSRETLEVKYKGKSIADVLDMTVSHAIAFFKDHPTIVQKLATLAQVGLDYLTLGQHATTLSGGEAQRVKLAAELSKKSTGHTLYVLDEPSTGLHFQDILYLEKVLKNLIDQGNSVLIIEHNMDIIKMADYIIDLGPEGGAAGGHIVAQGSPAAVASVSASYTGFFLQKELNREGVL